MMQQDEKGKLWLVMMSNLQGQGRVQVSHIPVSPPTEMERLAEEQADDPRT